MAARKKPVAPHVHAALADIDRVLQHARRKRSEASSNETFTLMLACIERLAPPNSPYAREASKIRSPEPFGGSDLFGADSQSQLEGVLRALRADIAAGKMATFAELVHGALFDDLLEQAEHLMTVGYFLPAVVIAGAALEEHLRCLAKKHGLSTERASKKKARKASPTSAADLNEVLKASQAYSQPEWRQVQAWLDLRNEAAHGKPTFANRTDQDVQPLIVGIRSFIVRHPA